ncbi:hypothetical protein MRX96_007542 [Rhipicephalus microplus]
MRLLEGRFSASSPRPSETYGARVAAVSLLSAAARAAVCLVWPLSSRPGGERARFTKLVNRPGKHERRRKGLSAIRGVRRRSKTGPNWPAPSWRARLRHFVSGPQTRSLPSPALPLSFRAASSPYHVPRRVRRGLYSISFDLPKSFLARLSRHRFSSCPCGRFRIAPAWCGRLFYEIEGRKTKSNNDDVTRRLDHFPHSPLLFPVHRCLSHSGLRLSAGVDADPLVSHKLGPLSTRYDARPSRPRRAWEYVCRTVNICPFHI